MTTDNDQQLDLSSIPKIINKNIRPKFVNRLNNVYWEARRMNENFVHYGGKVIKIFIIYLFFS